MQSDIDTELDTLVGIQEDHQGQGKGCEFKPHPTTGQLSPVADFLNDVQKMDATPSAIPWSRNFIADISVNGHDLNNVLKRHKMPLAIYLSFKDNPAYLVELKNAKENIQGEGMSFKQKAMTLADKHLVTIDCMVSDDETPAKERVSLIQSLAKWAGHEPKTTGVGEGNSFSVIINMDGNNTRVSLDE